MIINDDVVRPPNELVGCDRAPLSGKRVLVTRPNGQSAALVRQLEEKGALVSTLPAVEIREISDWGPVDRAIANLTSYQWLVFTSVNGVRAFVGRIQHTGHDLQHALQGIRLAAIGPATAEALRSFHLEPDVVPPRYRSEDLATILKDRVRGQRVLLARADRGRELLRDELATVADVEQLAVYSQVDASELDPVILTDLEAGRIDFITLTSSNIARALIRSLPFEAREHITSGKMKLITISPVTSAAVRETGLPIAAEAQEETMAGIITALIGLVARIGCQENNN